MGLKGLAGKVAVVTGGASGIGEATVRRLVAEDCRVLIVDFDGDCAETLAREIGKQALAVIGDVAEPETAARWVEVATGRFGRLDYVHNNAAAQVPMTPIVDHDLEAVDRAYAINLRGTFLGIQAALRHFRAEGKGGAIVNTSALAGIFGARGIAGYVGAKHGIVGITRTAAAEAGPMGVRVNCVCPGLVLTPLVTGHLPPAMLEQASAAIPLGRGADPSELGAIVAWLLSDEASYLNGAVIPADGGLTACFQ